jgi:hypothetical protein
MSDLVLDAVDAERALIHLDQAFATVRAKLLTQIADSEPGAHEARELAYHTLRAARMARAEIVSVINRGRVAAAGDT